MTRAIPNLKLFVLLLFISIVVFGLDKVGFLNTIKKYAYYLSNPISFGIYRTYQKVLQQFQFIYNIRNAAQENIALKEQLGELISENALLRKQLAEKEAFVAQEDYLSFQTYNLQAARPMGLGRYLKIDKGITSGIKTGDAAVFKDSYIGKVVAVAGESAQIQLLGDPDSKVAAFSQGKEGRARGVVTGQFGTDILMDKILHEEKISIGDLIYSEGTEGNLPRGLVLGKITEILKAENEVFKQASLVPIFSTRDLDLVFIIKE